MRDPGNEVDFFLHFNVFLLNSFSRLREHFVVGNATNKVDVSATRIILSNYCTSLTEVECGKVVREAFPGVTR